jgi:hypothetical protein
MKFLTPAIAAFILLMFSIPVNSQTVEPSSGVDPRTLQLEFESLYLVEREQSEQVSSWSIPSVLTRYGLSRSVEVQFNVPLLREAVYEQERMVSSRTFFDKVQAGVAVNLWREKGWLPEAALMARALIPVYEFDTSEVGSVLSLNLSNRLTESLSLNYNLGWIYEEEPSGYYITNLSWEISDRMHSFVELFGSTNFPGPMTHCINAGIGFNFADSFCLDLSMASGLNCDMMFFGGIFTYQLNI